MPDHTQRFSDRVADYIRYRPSYPAAALAWIRTQTGQQKDQVIADVGSGTGKLTELLLPWGNPVYAVEPNAAMREAAEHLLSSFSGFHSIEGTAEATGLPDASIDLIVAAQAFHWFDPTRTRAEFDRILRPGGWAVLIWNRRRIESTPFQQDYENLLQECGSDYREVRHHNVDDAAIDAFFAPASVIRTCFDYAQEFDWHGLRGRVLSASYAPQVGQPGHDLLMSRLQRLFGQYAVGGLVRFDYATEVYLAPWKTRHGVTNPMES
jgi:SAM-dependent methyltransferase